MCLLLRLSAALVKGTHGRVELGDSSAYTGQLIQRAVPQCVRGEGAVLERTGGTYADMLAARGTSSLTALQVVSSLTWWWRVDVRVRSVRACEVPAKGRRR